MSERHNPCADPLPPFWRSKVERAFTDAPITRPELTAFEADVLTLVGDHHLIEEIARRLGTNKNTVSDALFRARAKTRGDAS